MTEQERSNEIFKILAEELIPLMASKGHDYSGEDVLSNFQDFGWKGALVRLGDKYHRLKNFVKQGDLWVEDEKVEDTIKDLINYGFITLILYRSQQSTPPE
jgi:hypothetical protein